MHEVVLFPYLPLERRLSVSEWELIPRGQLTVDDTTSADLVNHAEGVARLYKMPGATRGYGAFVRPPGLRVGSVADQAEQLLTLYYAVVVSTLDANRSRADGQDCGDLNVAHRMCTSDNALLYGHRFNDDLDTSYRTGTMVSHLVGGLKIGETEGAIQPPPDMHLPAVRPRTDGEYTQALYSVLSGLGEADPDLPAAVRWLALAWTNSPSIDAAAQLLALRAGFDGLFGERATTVEVRQGLSALLDEPQAVRTRRIWTDQGRGRDEQLTELEWWFVTFALLRNKIAHGSEIPNDDWSHNGIPHVWHGEWNLRRAIKQLVANSGHPDVLVDPDARLLRRALEAFEDERQPEPGR